MGDSSVRRRFAARAKEVLDRIWVKVVLSIAIVGSLFPYQGTSSSAGLDAVFLTIFGIEFLCRVIIVTTRLPDQSVEAIGRQRFWEIFLLFLDFLALLSFVPWSTAPENARVLRVVRLTRLLLLVKYWGPLVRDIWTVLSRRERARQIFLMGFAVVILSFCGAVILQAVGSSDVDFNADGRVADDDVGFGTLLWWAFRQLQDPGNMIQSPLGIAVLVISTTLTIFGIFLISFLIGLGTDVVRELMELGRQRPPGFRDHTVIIGVTPTTPTLLRELLLFYRKLFRIPKYVILARSENRPEFLAASNFTRVVYRHGNLEEPGFLNRGDAAHAKRLILQADDSWPNPDAETTSILLSARQANPDALVVAEILDRSNVTAANVAAGAGAIIIPTEELLALFVSRATDESRTSDLVRMLVTSEGCEIYSYLFDWNPRRAHVNAKTISSEYTFDQLVARCVADDRDRRIVPLGLIRSVDMSTSRGLSFDIDFIGAAGGTRLDGIVGFIALGEDFASVRSWGKAIASELPAQAASMTLGSQGDFLVPTAVPDGAKSVLICGYRPATVALCELLIASNPGVRIHLLVTDAEQDEKAHSEFDDCDTAAGVLARHFEGVKGRFIPEGDDTFRLVSALGDDELGRVQIQRGDWTDHSVLSSLPFGISHVGGHDLVVLMEEAGRDSDGRTALAMLKMASLELGDSASFGEAFQLIAVVSDENLGERLMERYGKALPARHGRVRVVSSRAFRAFCTFQAAVVPAFEAIYSKLLGPARPGFVELLPMLAVDAPDDEITYAQCVMSLRGRGLTLVAMVLRDAEGHERLLGCPGSHDFGDRFRPSQVIRAWAVGDGFKRA